MPRFALLVCVATVVCGCEPETSESETGESETGASEASESEPAARRVVRRRSPRPAAVSTGTSNLPDALAEGLRLSWRALKEAHPNEHFYFFGIYTTEDAMYAQSMAGGESRFDHADSRWSAPDSPYLDEGTHFFADAQAFLNDRPYDDFDAEVKFRLDAFAQALRTVDGEGLFGEDRGELLLAVWWGDQSTRSMHEQARPLNPPDVFARFERDVPLAGGAEDG